jgi:hypothetical protein
MEELLEILPEFLRRGISFVRVFLQGSRHDLAGEMRKAGSNFQQWRKGLFEDLMQDCEAAFSPEGRGAG